MKLKSIKALLLVLIFCICTTACAPAQDNQKDSTKDEAPKEETSSQDEAQGTSDIATTPLLYKVTDEDGDVVWLFGSIHIGRQDYYPLPDYVMDAFYESESLAVEGDIIAFEKDLSMQIQALQPLLYTDGTTISDHIPPDLYDQAKDILDELGFYNKAMDYYCPAFWSSYIDTAIYEELGAETELGIDRHLLKKAKDTDKPILEIESALEQYTMLGGFSEELQELLLSESIESWNDIDTTEETLTQMMDLWAQGNEEKFSDFLSEEDEGMTAEELALYEEYNTALLDDRNLNMTDYAEERLELGEETFICVGAAHIVGEGAMVELLAQRGYTIECIPQQ